MYIVKSIPEKKTVLKRRKESTLLFKSFFSNLCNLKLKTLNSGLEIVLQDKFLASHNPDNSPVPSN